MIPQFHVFFRCDNINKGQKGYNGKKKGEWSQYIKQITVVFFVNKAKQVHGFIIYSIEDLIQCFSKKNVSKVSLNTCCKEYDWLNRKWKSRINASCERKPPLKGTCWWRCSQYKWFPTQKTPTFLNLEKRKNNKKIYSQVEK